MTRTAKEEASRAIPKSEIDAPMRQTFLMDKADPS
jgi:hypothetical protein